MPKFSIIMPVYNTGEILKLAVDSVLNQTYKDFELLLIDDGSTDGSPTLCDKYAEQDSRVKVFHKPNGGICDARNYGLDRASGEYIGFCDHDDEYLLNYLESVANVIQQHNVDYIKVGKRVVDERHKNKVFDCCVSKEIEFYDAALITKNLFVLMLKRVFGCIWDGFINANIIKSNKLGFDTGIKHGGEDSDFNYRLFHYVNSLLLMPNVLYVHYVRPSLSTSAKFYGDTWIGFFKEHHSMVSLAETRGYNFDLYPELYALRFIENVVSFVLYGIKAEKKRDDILPFLYKYRQSFCATLNRKRLFGFHVDEVGKYKSSLYKILLLVLLDDRCKLLYYLLRSKILLDKILFRRQYKVVKTNQMQTTVTGGHQPRNVIGFKAKLWRAVSNPWWLSGFILRKVSPLIKNDETFIKWEYFFGMKKFPNLENPKTYNEKMQWMKLHDRNPEYVRMVDKAAAKEYVCEVLGTDEHNIPTLGVWDSFDEIDFDKLPNQFVLKTTHDSGGVVIVKDKAKMDVKAARRKLVKSLKHNYFLEHREWPYLNVKPRIIAEKLMVDESGTELKDYKFFCFDGEPKMLFIATDRPHDTRFDFFDTDFNHLPFAQGHPLAKKSINKPDHFDEMLDLARRLSKGLHQVRVDLYNINGKIFFGELTFFHFSGNVPFSPAEWDEKIGSWWKLSKIN